MAASAPEVPDVPAAAPRVGAEEVAVDAGACVVPVEGLLKRFDVAPVVVVAAEAGAAELPPPRPPRLGKGDGPPPPPRVGNKDVPDAVVVVAPPLVAVVVAPVEAIVLARVDVVGLPQPKVEPPPVDAPAVGAAPAKRPLAGAAEDAGAAVPPRLRVGVELVVDCEVAGGAAGVAPRLNPDGFAGVEEGVVLPNPPKSPDLGAACAADCPVEACPGEKRPVGAGEAAGALLFASAGAPALPAPRSPAPGVELPRGFAAEKPVEAPPKRVGVVEEEVVDGFAPNNDEPACVAPPAWLFCWPNKEVPD